MVEISEKLKMARKASGMRQEDAAASMGMLRVTLSSIESGKRRVSTEELVKFSKLYNVDPNYLLEYDNDSNSDFYKRIRAYYKYISLNQKFSELSEDDRQEILDIIDLKLKKKRGENNSN